jgi:phage gp36-like protein
MQSIANWWQFLSERAGGDSTLSGYAPRDDSANHPRVLEAGAYAEAEFLSAIEPLYTPESITAFALEGASAAVHQHLASLAFYALTSAGRRSDEIRDDNAAALGWLQKVRSGQIVIDGLTKITTTVGSGSGSAGAVGRARVFSPDNCEYRRRTPEI